MSFLTFYGSPCHHYSTIEADLIALEARLLSALPSRARVEIASSGPDPNCTVYLDIVSIFGTGHKVIGPFKAELQFQLEERSDRT